MYQQIKDLSLFEQVEAMTESLVETLSINGTTGEVDIAEKVEQILRSFPYFQQHPEAVWTQALPHDHLGRKNVFARVKGTGNSKKTVIFHSHIDTVGIDDYGKQIGMANNPKELLHFFSQWDGSQEVQEHAQSGDWMFGRGALDMKSGVAVHLSNLLYFSQHPDEVDGEIIFMANPVEENQHTGVIAAVDELIRLREEEKLQYVVAINNDYISPLYPGDPKKYIYTGAGGKLLPCFYVYGRETHVGQTLNGLDPTLVTAELNRRINNNMDFTEQVDGEMVIPPSALYHRDTKSFYNVQTSVTSHLYFNVMVLEASPQDIMKKLKETAVSTAAWTRDYYIQQYTQFAQSNDFPDMMPSWEMDVYTYEEFCEKLSAQGVDVKQVTAKVVEENSGMELRQLCFEIVDRLRQLDDSGKPCMVIFYAPPYCPHNYLKGDSKGDQEVLQVIQNVTAKCEQEKGEVFAVKRFFPYLTDSSYLSLHDTDEEVASLIDNFPEWERIYPVPVKRIRELNVPAINVGVYGLDAHRWTERVYKPYSFDTVPKMIREMTGQWLGQSK
ncbi:M20/M25/M40 family metallo-hydrolase [Brevibacillus invocatus]|uniref:M20/M25/M40 family metallo-hydrolase n=1 Tax=Brevibacillus invocatus TaxID=173959 RepID=UPI0020418A0B|nr:M20/M25/M40 family metallo-hydrolase [Brevibacillus invocatus]MCM3082014.1 M20/M25/M40 family metallo-hydrolase [Brevibacillus invocatus]MCM3432414.1 M20/M25/M40 family metallo-hydrolase [Brevibacillus invocatus]